MGLRPLTTPGLWRREEKSSSESGRHESNVVFGIGGLSLRRFTNVGVWHDWEFSRASRLSNG